MFKEILKKQDYNKLKLFNYIGTKKLVEITELMDFFDLSRTSIKRYIKELNDFIEEHSDGDKFQIKQNESHYYYVTPLSQENRVYLYYKLRLSYLKLSPKFQLLEYMFSHESVTMHELCMFLMVSEAFCYKLIAQLNILLKEYSISIIKSNQRPIFLLSGTEQNIRNFYLFLLINSYHSMEWPLTNISRKSIYHLFSFLEINYLEVKNTSRIARIAIFVAIIDKRMRNNHSIEKFEEPIRSIIKAVIEERDVTMQFPYYPLSFPLVGESEQEQNEREYFNLFLRVIDSSIDSHEDSIRIGEKFRVLDNPITQFYTSFFPEFFKRYHITVKKTTLVEFLYHAVYYHVYSLYSSFLPTRLKKISRSQQPIFINAVTDYSKKIEVELEVAFKNSDVPIQKNSKFTVKFVSTLLASLVQINKDHRIHIYVEYAQDKIGAEFIKSQIHHFFSGDSIKFVKEARDSDIIVSDSIEDIRNEGTFFFFEDTSLELSWTNLFAFIQKKLFELYF